MTDREYKPTVPEIAPLVRALYAHEAAGGCLHIVLDDNNVENDSVDWCIRYAEERGCTACAKLGRALRSMSKTQRMKLSMLDGTVYAYQDQALIELGSQYGWPCPEH